MDSLNLRIISDLAFQDPKPFLLNLRKLEQKLASSKAPNKLKSLRTNSLKEWRELREAALFCYFMSERIGVPIFLAKNESQDYDFLASWIIDEETFYAPVQLKEVVPTSLNISASIENTISKIATKYVDSPELIIAIHLNQQCKFDPNDIKIPKLNLAELWIFGATSNDANQWALWGNFLTNPIGTSHKYPNVSND